MTNNFTKAVNSFIRKIKCKRTCLGWSHMTTGHAYRVTLTYKGKKCSFVFNDNYKDASKKEDFLYCLVLDAQLYENSTSFEEFKEEYGCGYRIDEFARRAYNSCRKQSERLHRLFTDEEIALLAMLD